MPTGPPRPSPASWARGTPRSRSRPPNSCWNRPSSPATGSSAAPNGWACGRNRRPASSVGSTPTALQQGRRVVRDPLLGTGLSEAYTFSLVSAADLATAGLPAEGIELENPLRAEESLLRPAVLPGLLKAVAFNAGQGLPDVGLFEIGHVFLPPPEGQTLPDEREHLAVVLAGTLFRLPHEPNRPV